MLHFCYFVPPRAQVASGLLITTHYEHAFAVLRARGQAEEYVFIYVICWSSAYSYTVSNSSVFNYRGFRTFSSGQQYWQRLQYLPLTVAAHWARHPGAGDNIVS